MRRHRSRAAVLICCEHSPRLIGETKNNMRRKAIPKPDSASTFLKQDVAARLREQILRGHLKPGQRIVESFWASRFGVAQISVREAINLLIADGFVSKATGRSARVIQFSHQDVQQIYEVRAMLEGLAARLAADLKADLTPLERAIAAMRKAIQKGSARELLSADLEFHLELCRLGGNEVLFRHAKSLLVPLFAFVSMRVAGSREGAKAWHSDLSRHQLILDVIAEGDAVAAESVVRAALKQFGYRAQAIWDTTKT